MGILGGDVFLQGIPFDRPPQLQALEVFVPRLSLSLSLSLSQGGSSFSEGFQTVARPVEHQLGLK